MCLKIYDRRGEITDNFPYLYYCLVLHPLQVLDFDDFDETSLFSRLQVFSISLHFPDFDECQNKSSNNCEQLCVNLPASFFCDCRDGYELNTDGRSCDGKTFPGQDL